MTEYRKNHGHDCDPTENPADQPKPPTDGEDCKETPPVDPPKWEKPEPCWTHDPCCLCPTKPEGPQDCLQDLIAEQAKEIVGAEKATEFKKVLEDLMAKAEAVRQDYTRDKYEKLVKEWQDQDEAIAKLIRSIVCDVPCWKCVLDCHVCSLINDIYVAEKSLYGDGKFCSDVHDLYDYQYWHQRNRDAKQRTFDRIKTVMTAWEKPADTIAAVLGKNKGLIDKINGVKQTESGKAIYDLFFVLIPMHLAIAPPAGEETTTLIDKKYTEFCKCEEIEPQICCGPDVGPWLLRQQMVQPQPYLIDPKEYFKLICCLVKKFYWPAKEELTKAEVSLGEANSMIAAAKKQYEDGLKNFGTLASAAIPSAVNCCDYEKKKDDKDQQQQQQY